MKSSTILLTVQIFEALVNPLINAFLVPLNKTATILDALAEFVTALRQINEFYEPVHIIFKALPIIIFKKYYLKLKLGMFLMCPWFLRGKINTS